MEIFKLVVGGMLTIVITVGLIVPTVLHYITTIKECRELQRQIDEERKRQEEHLNSKISRK